MTPIALRDRLLPLNRNRRRNSDGDEVRTRSEAGKRLVMGRKGIGKLSAFGAASWVTVRSKRKGQPYWTELTLAAADLLNTKDLADVNLTHKYLDAAQGIEEHGAIVTLSGIECSSAGFAIADIRSSLNEAFYPIEPEEFAININGEELKKDQPPLFFV